MKKLDSYLKELRKAMCLNRLSTGYRILMSCSTLTQIIFFFFQLINLFIFACVGSSLLCAGFRSERGLLFVAVRGLLIAVASLVVEHELQAHGLQ